MAVVYSKTASWLARMQGVKVAVGREADVLAARARSDLAGHRVTGNSKIVVRKKSPDSFVELVDEAALSIEFGRGEYTRSDGVTIAAMDGLHILGKLL